MVVMLIASGHMISTNMMRTLGKNRDTVTNMDNGNNEGKLKGNRKNIDLSGNKVVGSKLTKCMGKMRKVVGNNSRDKETGNIEHGNNRNKVTGAQNMGTIGKNNTVVRMWGKAESNGFHKISGPKVLMAVTVTTPKHKMHMEAMLVTRNNPVRINDIYMPMEKPPVPIVITILPILMVMLVIKQKGVGHLAYLDLVLKNMIGTLRPD